MHIGPRALLLWCALLGACAGTSTPKTPVGDASTEAVPQLSPWWASLFEEGATSRWTLSESGCDLDEDGEMVETDTSETEVVCKVSEVKREGGLWTSTVKCTPGAPNVIPEGKWITDGKSLSLPPYYQPLLTDPPVATPDGDDGSGTRIDGDTWCQFRVVGSGVGREEFCFTRGVGPTSDTLLYDACVTSTGSRSFVRR